MGLFGGGNSSSATSNTTQSTGNYGNGPTSTLNLSGVGTGKGSNVSIVQSDYGAISEGFGLAQSALDSISTVSQSAMTASTNALNSSNALASSTLDKSLSIAKAAGTSESSQLLDLFTKLGIAAAVVVGLMFFARSK